ncbi:glucose 1-dehydrogenase [Natrialba sp. PRR66]|uniref:glucose 1-dehydrogenase n=1 Tax=Natrialba sp. PRR66 TaxID=3098146 RepID=UPI002B1DC00A|nr:glucose 1-dehydrogenase [Natrialba sp. PRR66]
MNGIQDKTAVVTGASSGIGRASAQRFAAADAKVVVADTDEKGGGETVDLIEDNGGEATFIHTDVSKVADVEALVDAAVDTYGRLDFAHNNAGIEPQYGQITETQEADWERIMETNLKSVWAGLRYEIPRMVETGGGAIVNTSSEWGLRGNERMSIYSASKHGINGLTRTAALEYAEHNIRVNAVCPGLIETNMTGDLDPEAGAHVPIGRPGQPEEVAEAVVWLCSDNASFITGHPLPVDGGNTASS